MTANDKKTIKAKLVVKLEEMGFSVAGNDTPSLTVFTDKPVSGASVRIGNYTHGWITTFGPKSAIAMIQ